MAQVVKLKRTSVQGRIPTISNLELGELAINTHDGRIFFEKDNGELSIQEILTTNSQNSGSFSLQGAISASSLSISGDTTIGGNLTLGGNITIGDETTDSINITAEFSGSLLPDGNEIYDLGSSSKKWNNIWVKDVNATSIASTNNSTDTLQIKSSGVVRGTISGDGDGMYISAVNGLGLYTADGTDGVVIASNGDTTIYGSLQLQTIPLEATAVNAVVVGVGNTVSYRPLGSNAFSSENFLSVNGDSVVSGSSQVISLLSNQDVDLGTGDLTATDITSTNFTINDTLTAPTITGSLLRLSENGAGLRMTNVGAFDNSSGNFRIFATQDLILATNGENGTAVTIDQTTKDTNFVGAVTASYFVGDGSGITNLQVSSSIVEATTVTSSFDNQTSIVVNHNFDSRNVIVSVYDTEYEQIIPQSVILTDNDNVTISFPSVESGIVVVAKGGHIVSSDSLTTYRVDVSGASSYAVSHSLDEEYPFVQTWNTDTNKQEQPLDVESTSPSSLTVTFSGNFTGKIIVKR